MYQVMYHESMTRYVAPCKALIPKLKQWQKTKFTGTYKVHIANMYLHNAYKMHTKQEQRRNVLKMKCWIFIFSLLRNRKSMDIINITKMHASFLHYEKSSRQSTWKIRAENLALEWQLLSLWDWENWVVNRSSMSDFIQEPSQMLQFFVSHCSSKVHTSTTSRSLQVIYLLSPMSEAPSRAV